MDRFSAPATSIQLQLTLMEKNKSPLCKENLVISSNASGSEMRALLKFVCA